MEEEIVNDHHNSHHQEQVDKTLSAATDHAQEPDDGRNDDQTPDNSVQVEYRSHFVHPFALYLEDAVASLVWYYLAMVRITR